MEIELEMRDFRNRCTVDIDYTCMQNSLSLIQDKAPGFKSG